MSNQCANHIKIIGSTQQIEEFKQRYLYQQQQNVNITENFSFTSVLAIPVFENDINRIQQHDWCRENWGTKWDAEYVSTTIEQDELTIQAIEICCMTGQSPPLKVIQALSDQNPHLHFKMRYGDPYINFAGYQQYFNGILEIDELGDYLTIEQEYYDSQYIDSNINLRGFNQFQLQVQIQVQQPVRYQQLILVNNRDFTKYTRKTLIRYLSKHKVSVNIYKGKKLLFQEVIKTANKYKLDQLQCSICYETLKVPRKLDCNHIYCYECINKWKGDKPSSTCPLCRAPFN